MMRLALVLSAILIISLTACSDRAVGTRWTIIDARHCAHGLVIRLLDGDWRRDLSRSEITPFSLGEFRVDVAPDAVDIDHYRGELTHWLLDEGMQVSTTPTRLVLDGSIRRSPGDDHTWLYICELRLIDSSTQQVLWVDSMHVRKEGGAPFIAAPAPAPAPPTTTAAEPPAPMPPAPAPVDTTPSAPVADDAVTHVEPPLQAPPTSLTGVTVSKSGMGQTELLRAVSSLRQQRGIHAIREQLDNGTATLHLHVHSDYLMAVRDQLRREGWVISP